MKRILPLLLAALILAGCASAPSPTTTPEAVKAYNAVTMPKALAVDDYEGRAALRESVTEEQMAGAINFSIRSAQAVLGSGEQTKNRLYSPLSLYFALSMLAETAGGETKSQILSSLDMDEAAWAKTSDIYRLLYADDQYTKLLLANSAWVQNSQGSGKDDAIVFHQEALDALAQRHFAEVFAADFENPQTGDTIGNWIFKKTNGLLGGAFHVPEATLMMLINTVYYKSEWTEGFQAESTAPGAFHNADGSESSCDFMHKTSMQSFVRTEQYTSSTLGLKGDGMVRFILPNEGVAPKDILTGNSWAQALEGGEATGYGTITWQVPKLNYNESLNLNEAAKALGIEDALDPNQADFSPLSDSPLYVSSIHQQSAITMDENGIEAASYTDIAMAGTAMPTDQAEMILDRPFIYVIYVSGLPLFVGVVNAM